jgi:hypothetical protein
MEKLIAELTRLYLAPEAVTREALAQHILGKTTLAIKLTTADDLTRALAIPFRKAFGDGETGPLGAPVQGGECLAGRSRATGAGGEHRRRQAYRLWLSLETPVAAERGPGLPRAAAPGLLSSARAGARRRHRAGLFATLPEPAQRQVGGIHPSGHGRVLR